MVLQGTVALVTGGAARVGRAVALALAERGATVAITYRTSREAAAATVADLRAFAANSIAVPCDQRDPEQVRVAIETVERELGPVGILVNNAAIFERTPVEACSIEDWDRHLEVNLRGPWLFAQAIGLSMKQRGSGCIIQMLDIAAERPYPGYLPYSVSKAGLAALTSGLAAALAPEVRVNGIAPGAVEWPPDFDDAAQAAFIARTPLARAGTSADIARAALYLIEADFVTGTVMTVDGGRSLR